MLSDILKLRSASEQAIASVENVMVDLRVNALLKDTRAERRKSTLLCIVVDNLLRLIMFPLVAISHLRSLIIAITSALVCLVILENVTALEAVALTFLFWSLLNINEVVNSLSLLAFDLIDFISLGQATVWCLNFYRDLPIERRHSFITSANRNLVNHLYAGRQVWGYASETAWEAYFVSLSIEFGHDAEIIQQEIGEYWIDVEQANRSLLNKQPPSLTNLQTWWFDDIWPDMTVPVVIKLLDNLSDIDELGTGGTRPNRTILGVAVSNNAPINVVQKILDRGPDLHIAQPTGWTRYDYSILACAITGSDVEIVKLLLDSGADVDNSSINQHDTIPVIAMLASKDPETFHLILKSETASHSLEVGNPKYSLLHLVVEQDSDQSEQIKFLIDYGYDINIQNLKNETPLLVALKGGSYCTYALNGDGPIHHNNILTLIELGARVDMPDIEGETPLQTLAGANWGIEQKDEIAKLLIDRGAEVNQKDNAGYSPLHRATFANSAEMVRCLLSLGADPNTLGTVDYEPSSAFFIACKGTLKLKYEEYMPRDYAEIVNFFLEAGCDPHKIYETGRVGVTPAQLIRKRLSKYNDGTIKFPGRIAEILKR